MKVTHVPLFHSLVCPGVIVAPAHSRPLLPFLPSRAEEADVNTELQVGRALLCKPMVCVCECCISGRPVLSSWELFTKETSH